MSANVEAIVTMRVKVGIVDSGVDTALADATDAAVGIDARLQRVAAAEDAVGHGSAVARIVLALAPPARLVSAQAFDDGRRADAARVAQGIEWCVELGARVVNLSLGLAADRAELRRACAAATAQGAIVIASSPARGTAVFPAAYDGVLAVCGDARCAPRAWSVLEAGRRYGAAPLAADDATPGGASYAAARLSGLAAAFLAAQPAACADDFRRWLSAGAAFHGRERRVMAAA